MRSKTERIKFTALAVLIFALFVSCSRTKKEGIPIIDDIAGPPPRLLSISVTPKDASIPIGAKQKFIVTGKYDNQTTKNITGGITWKFSENIGTVNASGEVTGVSPGKADITVTVGAFSETVTLTVSPKTLQSLAVTTGMASIPLRQTTQFTATGTFNVGDEVLTARVTWISSNNSVATIDIMGMARGISPGTVTITAITPPELGSFQATSSLEVQNIKIKDIEVSAKNEAENNLPLPAKMTRQFKATGQFSDNTTQDVTSAAIWDSSNKEVATVSTGGLVTGILAGKTVISATLGPVSNTLPLTVGAALNAILIAPINETIVVGLNQRFTATGLLDGGGSQDVTSQVTWSSSSPSVANFNDQSGPNKGLVTALSSGVTVIQATLLDKSATTTLTVKELILASISVTPINSSVAKGTTQQFKAVGTYQETIGTSTAFSFPDITHSVTWGSDTTTVATMSNTTKGLAKAEAEGTSTITATLNAISGSTTLTVIPAALTFISVATASNNYTVFVDGGEQFVATGYFTDGSAQDITDDVYWSVGGGSMVIATIDNSTDVNKGYAFGVQEGEAPIYADFGQKQGTSTLKVTQELVQAIRVEPNSRFISVATALQFQAIGILGNGSEQDITSFVTWSSLSPSVATIIAEGQNRGLAHGISAGQATIKASFSQKGIPRPAGLITLTVIGSPLERISITPKDISIPLGTRQQYIAKGYFEDKHSQDITSLVTWTTGSSAVAAITSSGLATSNAIGKTNVTASFGGVTDLTPLEVNSAILNTISVTPADSSLGIGTSRQYTAKANFIDNPATLLANEEGSYDVTSYGMFRSTDTSVAIINQTGFATGGSTGTTTIEAIFLGMTGTATLTVKSLGLTRIDVTPQNASVAMGGHLPFTATGVFADGSTQTLTHSVSWTTSAYLTATVSNIFGSNGVVTGVNSGTVIITASFGLASGSATLKVGGAAPTHLVTGGGHTCALLTNGQLRCWGKNGLGQLGKGDFIKKNSSSPQVVANVNIAAAISSGGSHTCSALSNGVAQCWGSNQFGQLGIGTNTIPDADAPTNVKDILGVEEVATGLSHTCAILDGGAIECWGENGSGQLGIGTVVNTNTPTSVGSIDGITAIGVEIAAGGSHTCAVVDVGITLGTVQCWGKNESGQLGIGTSADSNIPVNVNGLSVAKSVAAGGNHTCALLADGAVKCWGKNGSGQLGTGTSVDSTSPVGVSGIDGNTVMAVAISAGENHTCAIVDIGETLGGVRCWGDNSSGQLGNATTTPSNMPVTVGVGGKALGISSGRTHTCALLEGGVAKCWGSNQFGQLGNSAQIISTDPVLIPEMASSTTVQAGLLHTCAIAQSGGGIKCVGSNRLGQLGDGTKVSAEKPVDVVGISGANEVTAGNSHTCALLADRSVKCWGENGLGQLGDGTMTTSLTPVDTGITTASSISAGGEHVCALLTDGTIKCLGGNANGQLGNNSVTDADTPVPVNNISEGKAVSAGGFHTCAIVASARTVQCWGDNANGQLGDGQTTSSAIRVDVTGIANVDEISLGRVHTCARVGGTVWCWGDNSKGQLGDGGNVPSAVPVIVSGISTAIRITTGNDYSCAILLDGTVQCWGENESGQLGDGTTINANTPVESNPLLAAATVVTAGQGHTCALLVDNRVQCWGDASYSQIGDQVILIEESPVAVIGL